MSDIKLGDVVVLKSGGGPMTVESIECLEGAPAVVGVAWHPEGATFILRDTILIVALKKA